MTSSWSAREKVWSERSGIERRHGSRVNRRELSPIKKKFRGALGTSIRDLVSARTRLASDSIASTSTTRRSIRSKRFTLFASKSDWVAQHADPTERLAKLSKEFELAIASSTSARLDFKQSLASRSLAQDSRHGLESCRRCRSRHLDKNSGEASRVKSFAASQKVSRLNFCEKLE